MELQDGICAFSSAACGTRQQRRCFPFASADRETWLANSGTTGKLADNYDVEAVALGKGGFAVGDSDLALSFVSVWFLGTRVTWMCI